MNNYEIVAHFAREGAALFFLLMCVCLYLITVGVTTVSTIRHQHFINARYSHTENLRTHWAAVIASIYAALLAIYTLALGQVTWVSDLIYNLVSVTIWIVMFIYATKHRVLHVVDEDEHGYAEKNKAKGEELYVRGIRLTQVKPQAYYRL